MSGGAADLGAGHRALAGEAGRTRALPDRATLRLAAHPDECDLRNGQRSIRINKFSDYQKIIMTPTTRPQKFDNIHRIIPLF